MKPLVFPRKVALILLMFIITSCNLPSYTHRDLRVVINKPVTGSVYLLGSSIEVRALSFFEDETAVPTSNLTNRFLFFANGMGIGEANATDGANSRRGTVSWTPGTSGEYSLQAEAIVNDQVDDRGGVSIPSVICVLDVPGTNIYSELGLPPGSSLGDIASGSCLLPPQNPTESGAVAFNMNIGAAPSSIAIPTNSCPDIEGMIRFTAIVNEDPGDNLAFIVVKVQTSPALEMDRIILHYSGLGASGEKIYTGDYFLPVDSISEPQEINWRTFAFGRDGSTLAIHESTIGVDTILAAPCMAPVRKIEDTPTPTLIIVTETTTPTLIPVILPSPTKEKEDKNDGNSGGGNNSGNPGGNPPPVCGNYNDYQACVNAGCTWDGGYCQ